MNLQLLQLLLELELQGTVPGPNDFKLVINDLTFDTTYAKYVHNTTVISVSKNVNDDTLQACADHLVNWTQRNGMLISTNKTRVSNLFRQESKY